MELILRVDIPKLGKAGTIVNVAEGYARNYLLPKKLADKPTQDAKDQIEAIVRRRRIEEAKELEACQEMAKRLEDITVKLARKAGEDEKLFGFRLFRAYSRLPDEYMGDVMGDLNSRRGMIKEMEAVTGAQRITAYVPLSEMFGYATDLRSKTQGRGQYSMEPSHYSEVPKSIQEKIINDRSRNNA